MRPTEVATFFRFRSHSNRIEHSNTFKNQSKPLHPPDCGHHRSLFISFHRLSLSCGVSFMCVFPHLYIQFLHNSFLLNKFIYSLFCSPSNFLILTLWSVDVRGDGWTPTMTRKMRSGHTQWPDRYTIQKKIE